MSDVEIVVGGLVIVFLGMVAIVGLLYLISGAIRLFSKEKKPQRSKDAGTEKTALNTEETVKDASDEAAVQPAEDASDEELAAVIAAAVAAYTGDSVSAPRFKVTSFKRVGSRGGRG